MVPPYFFVRLDRRDAATLANRLSRSGSPSRRDNTTPSSAWSSVSFLPGILASRASLSFRRAGLMVGSAAWWWASTTKPLTAPIDMSNPHILSPSREEGILADGDALVGQDLQHLLGRLFLRFRGCLGADVQDHGFVEVVATDFLGLDGVDHQFVKLVVI